MRRLYFLQSSSLARQQRTPLQTGFPLSAMLEGITNLEDFACSWAPDNGIPKREDLCSSMLGYQSFDRKQTLLETAESSIGNSTAENNLAF